MEKKATLGWILVCGLVCGAVWVLLSAVLMGVLGSEFLAAAARGRATPLGSSVGLMFGLTMAAGVWAIWMYAIARPLLGGGLKPAAVIGLAWWVITVLQSAKWLILEGVPASAALPLGVAILPAMIVATGVGAALYERGVK